jgi:class 3 adenylate cyclase
VRNWTLRTRLLVASSTILVALIGATLLYVSQQANRFVSERLTADLRRTRDQILIDERDRLHALRVTAELIASFPELRALLATDSATVRDFLIDYQKRTGRSELLIALGPSGRVVARTDAPTPIAIPDVQSRWLQPALSGHDATGFLITEDGAYESAVVPAEAAGNVFGFLLVGTPVDDVFARRLRDLGRDEVVVFGPNGVLGSTLESRRLPWQSAREWDAMVGGRRAPIDVDISGERYVALAGANAAGSPVRIVTLQSRDVALAPYRRIQVALLLLGVLGALAGIAASAWVARSVTAPLQSLAEGTHRVATGDYDFSLDVSREDEIGELARAFNVMTRGLRERADMQKFVSQSTVEMIQAGAGRKVSDGERKPLTILITDLRGFTTFAEGRPPEQVIAVLNRCLSVQAQRVRKFGGDVDKFVGDSLVALFSGDDMALNAIRCAVEIQHALEYATESAGAPLDVGIGVATGEVILGSIGSEERRDYTAVGAHVNLAARLCSMASGREILLAESTWQQVQDLVAAERLDEVRIRGLQVPVTVYRMTVRPSESRAARNDADASPFRRRSTGR